MRSRIAALLGAGLLALIACAPATPTGPTAAPPAKAVEGPAQNPTAPPAKPASAAASPAAATAPPPTAPVAPSPAAPSPVAASGSSGQAQTKPAVADGNTHPGPYFLGRPEASVVLEEYADFQ